MRIQVEINVENPLPDGFPLSRPRKPATWISFKYERLSNFCYCCGCLGHIQQAWPYFQTQTEVSNYGPWMRAENTTATRLEQAQNFHHPTGFSHLEMITSTERNAAHETKNFFPQHWKEKVKCIKKNKCRWSLKLKLSTAVVSEQLYQPSIKGTTVCMQKQKGREAHMAASKHNCIRGDSV